MSYWIKSALSHYGEASLRVNNRKLDPTSVEGLCLGIFPELGSPVKAGIRGVKENNTKHRKNLEREPDVLQNLALYRTGPYYCSKCNIPHNSLETIILTYISPFPNLNL